MLLSDLSALNETFTQQVEVSGPVWSRSLFKLITLKLLQRAFWRTSYKTVFVRPSSRQEEQCVSVVDYLNTTSYSGLWRLISQLWLLFSSLQRQEAAFLIVEQIISSDHICVEPGWFPLLVTGRAGDEPVQESWHDWLNVCDLVWFQSCTLN